MTQSTCPSSSTDAAFSIPLSNGLSFYGIDRRQLPAVRFLVNEIFRGNYYFLKIDCEGAEYDILESASHEIPQVGKRRMGGDLITTSVL